MCSAGTLLLALGLGLSLAGCAPELRELHYPDGSLFERAEWRGPARDGLRRNFFQGGEREREVSYRAGLPAGTWSVWNPAGTLLSTGAYVDGRRSGEWIERFDDGALRSRGTYVAGDKDGLWVYGDPSGKPAYEETWRRGTLIRARSFDADH